MTISNEVKPLVVPADFPRIARHVALPGAHLKFSAVRENGKFYAEGLSPNDVMNDYLLCEDIAQQMILYYNKKVLENKLNIEEIILRIHQGLIHQDWCRPEHTPWVVRRLATLVNVPVPSGIPELTPHNQT
jgi:hypothetical protein